MKARNGEIVLASEGYKSRTSAQKGVASVQKNYSDPSHFEKKKTSSGKYRFNVKAKNRQIIGTSENYNSEASRDNGIKAVARAAKGAKLIDLTKR